jgi:hypothetical protein
VGIEDDFGISAAASAFEREFSAFGGIDVGRYPDQYSGDIGRAEQTFIAGAYREFGGACGSAYGVGKRECFERVLRVWIV